MALSAGTRLGPYEVVSAIGAGGMGEVYKATDTRLSRTVAIKILPTHASSDEMKARFAREAQTIAGLSHPNICTLHDVGHDEGVDYLVLEYLEGQTLADRLARGAMPLAEVLKVAIDIADALTKAHRQGIVHRDLKPANVMLTKTGPKLLDFGLAKWTATEGESLAAAPTRADITGQGMMLGTLKYMAPEQIEGKDADARTDIFAFGALLYEMVTGRRAFQGKSQATLIASILSRDPRPMSEFVPVSPPALEHLVERCLQKEPDNRWQAAQSLVMQLRWIAYGGADASAVPVAEPANPKRERLLVMALGITTLATAALAFPAYSFFRPPAPQPPFSYRSPVIGFSQSNFAVSPDGTTVVFAAVSDPADASSTPQLYVRPTRAQASRRLNGTTNATQPFWSPDSKAVGFVADGMLKRIDVADGRVQTIAPVTDFQGGAWSKANVMLYGSPAGIFRVSAEGGTPEALTTLGDGETGHYFPGFLPDGRHFLYLSWTAEAESRTIYAASIDGGDRHEVMKAASNAVYAEPGYLLFHRASALFAQPFDARSFALSGEAVRIAGAMMHSEATGRGDFSASDAGVLVYFEGASTGNRSALTVGRVGFPGPLGWVDRTGSVLGPAGEPGAYGDFDLSPDGRHIAVTLSESSSLDIWTIDLTRGVADRLTQDPDLDANPVWSNDGTRIAFTTSRNGNADVYIRNANGTGADEPLLNSGQDEYIEAWSRDGKFIAYEMGQGTIRDLYVKPMTGDGKAFPVVTGKFRKGEPQFSPDGKWLAYVTDESTTAEVYVMSFPDGKDRRRVSTAGGGQPRWAPDSRTLYYLSADGQWMSVDVGPGPQIDITPPKAMFRIPFSGPIVLDPYRHQMAVHPNGDRFLMRIQPQPAAGRAGEPTSVPFVAATFVPPNAGAVGARGTGRGVFLGRSASTSAGLTVILHWPSMIGSGQQ